MLCFERDEWVSERIGDVLICSSQNVVAQLKTRHHVLAHATVEQLAAEVTGLMEAPAEQDAGARAGAPGRARAT